MNDLITLVVAIIALLISGYVAYRQIKLTKLSNSYPVVSEMFKEFRSLEFKEHLNYVTNTFLKDNKVELGINNLPEEVKSHVKIVSHFFDHLGVMVANNVADKNLVICYLGGAAEEVWNVLSLNIKFERDFRPNGLYQEFFENLVWEIKNNPPEKLIKKLSLRRIDT